MITLTWKNDLLFEAVDAAGHKIPLDTTVADGGTEKGMAPIELLLAALAGCMAMDIVAILRKKGGRVKSFQMSVDGDRAADHPRRYLKIRCRIKGDGEYQRDDLERSFELSRDKFCSVLGTFRNPPQVEFTIE